MSHRNHHTYYSTLTAKAILLVLSCVFSCILGANAKDVRLTYVGGLPDNKKVVKTGHVKVTTDDDDEKDDNTNEGDTTAFFNILNKFEWNVRITAKNGQVVNVLTSEPDTIDFGNYAKVELSTDFTVAPYLLDTPNGLKYELNGSVLIKLNGEPILATGHFNTLELLKYRGERQENYTSFIFKDTVNHLDIIYLPHPKMKTFFLSLKMGQHSWADNAIASTIKDNKESYALGFYYLSFGIVFLVLFIFFREKIENLYFAMFCLFASFSWIMSIYETSSITPFTTYFGAFSFEFLSIFFAKVIKNKRKSKVPLIIMTVVAIASFHPSILYNYTLFGIKLFGNLRNLSVPPIMIAIFVVFYAYTIGASIYYLSRGLRQKSWEAKTVVYICISALFISYILPSVIGSISIIRELDGYHEIKNFMGNLGLCIYPLSAAIVLGRRNSLNQKQLATHVKSIEQLSNESLRKEQEKKQILENQNASLEHKVEERTHEVLEQKKLIEAKNKAITDNLTYAQRIQKALLPDVKHIQKVLKDSFILYLPKDIVSGDFYAFAEEGNKALIVAGDCTGHGVSGAFMSMIGNSLLNQIVNEKGVTEPAAILNALNTSVIDTLKQTKNDSNDGMDIALCIFDFDKYELLFAGANRPLWIVRDGDLLVLPPDKFPIGGLQVSSNREFKSNQVSLQKNDTIYLFTDGYADQFGGENGKKMMTAKFKAMLLSIQHMDMQQQLRHLTGHFMEWKGKEEQVDDVLVIGIKI